MFADSYWSCVSPPFLCQLEFFSARVTLKYWHLHTNILVIFHLFPFIVVIIGLVKSLSGSDSICVCETVPDFCLHSCTYNTLILAVYEFAGVYLAAGDICKYSYMCNTICLIIEMVIFLFFSAAVDMPCWPCILECLHSSPRLPCCFQCSTPLPRFYFLWWDCQTHECCSETILRILQLKKKLSSQVLYFLVQVLDSVL